MGRDRGDDWARKEPVTLRIWGQSQHPLEDGSGSTHPLPQCWGGRASWSPRPSSCPARQEKPASSRDNERLCPKECDGEPWQENIQYLATIQAHRCTRMCTHTRTHPQILEWVSNSFIAFRALERNKKVQVTLHIQSVADWTFCKRKLHLSPGSNSGVKSVLGCRSPVSQSCHHKIKTGKQHLHWTCKCSLTNVL